MNKNQYSTTSLALAAAIQIASSSRLQFVDHSRTERSEFVFNRTSDLDRIVGLFWQRTLPVDAISYFETIKYIKSRLYENK